MGTSINVGRNQGQNCSFEKMTAYRVVLELANDILRKRNAELEIKLQRKDAKIDQMLGR